LYKKKKKKKKEKRKKEKKKEKKRVFKWAGQFGPIQYSRPT
jgi:hypothetical protein